MQRDQDHVADWNGRWAVTTGTSTYLLDINTDGATLTRAPDTGSGSAGARVATLRRDHQPIPLLKILQLELGRLMLVAIRIVPGVLTFRETTCVTDICQLTAPQPPAAAERVRRQP